MHGAQLTTWCPLNTTAKDPLPISLPTLKFPTSESGIGPPLEDECREAMSVSLYRSLPEVEVERGQAQAPELLP